MVTTLCTYGVSSTEGMMIESLSIPRAKENFDGLEFSVQLKQIRIVKNARTQVKQKAVQTRKKKDDGHKTTEPPKKKVTALKDKYNAKQSGDWVGVVTRFGG